MSCKARGIRTVGVLLWRMIVDGADELAILPSDDDYRLVALVDGEEVELEPPPLFLHRPTVATVRAIWESDPNGDGPLSGVLRVHTDEGSAMVEATVTPTPAGDSISFRFSYPDDISTDSPIPQPAAMV